MTSIPKRPCTCWGCRGRKRSTKPACCSIALGDEVLALDSTESGIAIDVQHVIERERSRRRPHAALSRIPVVVRA